MTGIKLEVGKRYRDGYGKPRAIVMRLSASVYMAHDGAKYSDTGKRLVEYEYDSRFDLIALAPDEAPEPQPDELAALRARVAELEQELAAHDHTIAEIGERAAALRASRDHLSRMYNKAEIERGVAGRRAEASEAENARLREALEKIASESDGPVCCGMGTRGDHCNPPECCGSPTYGLDRAQEIARTALLASLRELTIAAEASGWDVDADNAPILNAARAAIAKAKG